MLVLAVLAAIPALLLWGVWQWADGRARVAEDAVPPPEETVPVPEPRLALSTSLLSMRRSASELSRDLNLAAFESAVEPLTNSVNERSCVAVSLDGVLVGEANPRLPVIPASNQKILVAAVAEEVLGPDHVYTTTVVGPEPVAGVAFLARFTHAAGLHQRGAPRHRVASRGDRRPRRAPLPR